jgi:enoyl-CoA hydratase/carnithine racemase
VTKKTIECEEKDQIALVRLDVEPTEDDRFLQISYEFTDFCAEISSKEDVRVFVILLKGKKSSTMEENRPGLIDRGIPSMVDAVSALEIPVIIGLDGYIIGQDLELALACDIRVATQESFLGFPHIEKGYIPSQGGTQRLPRLVGKGMALEMVLTGNLFDMETSRRIGLVSRIVKRNELHADIMTMANEMSQKSPISLMYSKEAINKGMDLTLEQGIRLEAGLYYLIHTTQDRSEGIKAFQEKRPPTFKGT